ncbi:hypothetical protein SBA7_70017 [Candidatus Sulfotelmatobacter sp. SbA7]|nr:hypothetical protein SBA7_70017 [Candidatus Sulfotelmatobacter sp. SbA7]
MHRRIGKRNRERVERATVRLVERGGHGVLVPGGFILTATHCIDWSGTGGMVLGDVYPTGIETASGVKFRVGVYACDPVADIAVLGELENQECSDDADAFQGWCEQVEPVALCTSDIETGQPCPVFVYTHKHEWIAGSVTRFGALVQSSVALCAEDIESGTSGSPVVTGDGLLLGIVSNTSSHPAGASCGGMPVPYMSLPHWVLARTGLRLHE